MINKKIFVVTGGAGFIGSYITKYLLELGHTVKVLDDFSNGHLKNLEKIHDDIEIINDSILQKEKLEKIITKTDGIFHQAALISVLDAEKQKDNYFKVNVT